MLYNRFKFDCRSNEERLQALGKSFSGKSRKYRAKRIEVNLKVNAFAYAMETFGGIFLALLSAIPHANYLYTFTLIWYGNVIPSCYLTNSMDIKILMMEDGWWNGLSKIYRKKTSHQMPSSSQKRNLETKKDSNKVKGVKDNEEGSDQCKESSKSGEGIKATMIQDGLNKYQKGSTTKNRKENTSKIRQGVIINDLEQVDDNSLNQISKTTVHYSTNTPTAIQHRCDKDSPKMYSTVFQLNPNCRSVHPCSTQDYETPIILPNEVDYS